MAITVMEVVRMVIAMLMGRKKDAVLVTVQDTGVGINSKIKDQSV